MSPESKKLKVRVPPPVSAPVISRRSELVPSSYSKVAPAVTSREPKVRVPGEFPGAMMEPAAAVVTEPVMEPSEPPRRAASAMETAVFPREPLMRRVPAEIVVVPV